VISEELVSAISDAERAVAYKRGLRDALDIIEGLRSGHHTSSGKFKQEARELLLGLMERTSTLRPR
jgi:hypothetical protein